MATYKYTTHLSQNNHAAFDQVLNPGVATPYSGIYRCIGCGHEAASNQNQPLPPQTHHKHQNEAVPIRWQLNVSTQP